MNKQFWSIKNMTYMAMFASLITICSYIKLALNQVPFTMQTFGVFLCAGLLGKKRGTMAVIVYVLLGAIGLPVFAGNGGIGSIIGPTGGYITGFIFTAYISGLLMESLPSKNLYIFISLLIGDLCCFILGTIQFMYVNEVSLLLACTYCVFPFIIPDLLKMVLATILIQKLKGKIK